MEAKNKCHWTKILVANIYERIHIQSSKHPQHIAVNTLYTFIHTYTEVCPHTYIHTYIHTYNQPQHTLNLKQHQTTNKPHNLRYTNRYPQCEYNCNTITQRHHTPVSTPPMHSSVLFNRVHGILYCLLPPLVKCDII